MKISKQARRDAKELFRLCTVNGLLDENRVRQTVQRVLEARPRGYLAILSHFQRLLRLAVEQRTARIDSPVSLSPEFQSQIRTGLEQAYGPGLRISFGEDSGLLGGLRIRVGSDVYDGSIRARLAALEESF